MSYPDPHLRARDGDRDRSIEEIEAAFVDGQITAEDRDIRVGNALKATSLGELGLLTRDLQVPAGTPLTPVTPGTGARSTRWLVPILGVAGALVMLAVVGVVVAALVGAGDPATQVARPVGQDPVVAGGPSSPDTFRMTPAGVRRFVSDYEAEFGTTDVLEATLYADDRILLEVPTRGHPNRHENWTYRGEFTQDTEATTNAFKEQPIDLRALDVRRLFANISRAEQTLGVQDAELTHVGLSNIWSDEEPAVNIFVRNDFDESAYLKTGLDGHLIRAYSFE